MNSPSKDKILWGISLILGQLLMMLATFFWNDAGRYSPTGAVFNIFSVLFWTVGFIGLFDMFKEKIPGTRALDCFTPCMDVWEELVLASRDYSLPPLGLIRLE